MVKRQWRPVTGGAAAGLGLVETQFGSPGVCGAAEWDMKFAHLIGISTFCAFAMHQPAAAADLPVKAPPKAQANPPPFDWTGFYFGGHVGYASLSRGRPGACSRWGLRRGQSQSFRLRLSLSLWSNRDGRHRSLKARGRTMCR